MTLFGIELLVAFRPGRTRKKESDKFSFRLEPTSSFTVCNLRSKRGGGQERVGAGC